MGCSYSSHILTCLGKNSGHALIVSNSNVCRGLPYHISVSNNTEALFLKDVCLE